MLKKIHSSLSANLIGMQSARLTGSGLFAKAARKVHYGIFLKKMWRSGSPSIKKIARRTRQNRCFIVVETVALALSVVTYMVSYESRNSAPFVGP